MARLGMTALEGAAAAHGGARDNGAGPGWPQEVRRLLFEAQEEASRLRAERQSLLARQAELERDAEAAGADVAALREQLAAERERGRVREGALRADQRRVQEAADRTALALRSGQEAAETLIERAQQRAVAIEQHAHQEAAALRQRVETEAAKVLRIAHFDAEGLLQEAQASAEDLLARAQRQGHESVAELRKRRDQLREEIDHLEARRLELLETCAAIRRPIDDAIRTLQQPADRAAAPPVESPRARRAIASRLVQRASEMAAAVSARRPEPTAAADTGSG